MTASAAPAKGLPEGPLVAWYGDDFTGSAAVMEVLTFAGLPSVLFLAPPTPAQLARFAALRGIGIASTARAHGPDWMDRTLPAVFAMLRELNAPITHYKVCSTLDSAPEIGSIGRAIDLALPVLGSAWTPILVAAPPMRRYQLFGHLFAAGPGGVARWAGTSFKPRWEQPYRAKVTHVLGEFYWPVRLEQEARVTDYVSGDGRQLLSREATRDEVTWSHGRVLPAEEVRRAFSLPQQAAPTLQRDASAFSKSGTSFFTVIVVSLLILLLLVLVMRAVSRDSCQSYKDSFGEFSNEYQQCRASLARSSGSGYSGSSGGSWGGYSSGGGGHK